MKVVPSGVTSWVVKYWPAVSVVSCCSQSAHSYQPSPRNG